MSEVKRYRLPDLLMLDGRTVVDSVDYDAAENRIAELEAAVKRLNDYIGNAFGELEAAREGI